MIEWFDVKEKSLPVDQEVVILLSDGTLQRVVFNKWWPATPTNRVTHWACFNEPVKKRWMPKDGEIYYFINSEGSILNSKWIYDVYHASRRHFLGVYKTESEAVAARDKIKEFVKKEIGEI